MRAAVREHAEQGVDVIKIMASGGTLTPGSRQDLAQFPPEVLRAAVDEAHRLGLRVTAHAHAVTAIADAVAAGVDGLEHVSFWTEDGVDAPETLIQLIASQPGHRRAHRGHSAGAGMARRPEVVARFPGIMANTRRLHEAGAAIVAGTDAGIAPVKPHDVVRHAPPVLRQLGFGPAEALRRSPRSRPESAAWGAARDASRPASTPTFWPSTATRWPTRTRCTASGRSTPAARRCRALRHDLTALGRRPEHLAWRPRLAWRLRRPGQRARRRARSLDGPAWPLTQNHCTWWPRAAESSRCHRSAFLTGFLSRVFQPLRFQTASHSVTPFRKYWLSVYRCTSHGRVRLSSPRMAAMISMRLFVVAGSPP